jgi:hypothetical protein
MRAKVTEKKQKYKVMRPLQNIASAENITREKFLKIYRSLKNISIKRIKRLKLTNQSIDLFPSHQV